MKPLLYSPHPDMILRWHDALKDTFKPEVFTGLNKLDKLLSSAPGHVVVLHLTDDKKHQKALTTLIQRWHNSQIFLILSDIPDNEQAIQFFRLGVRGYANAYLSEHQLHLAIETISDGEVWASPQVLQHLCQLLSVPSESTEQSGNIEADCENELSPREIDIVHLVIAGHNNKEIANELKITERTVKAHLTHVFQKLEVRNRLELTVRCRRESPVPLANVIDL